MPFAHVEKKTPEKRILFHAILMHAASGANCFPPCPTNISGQKIIWMASFMLPLGLDYVQ